MTCDANSPVSCTGGQDAEVLIVAESTGAPSLTVPPRLASCGRGRGGPVVFVNDVTSCQFASNVADRWAESGASTLRNVYSPATMREYEFSYHSIGRAPVCTAVPNSA